MCFLRLLFAGMGLMFFGIGFVLIGGNLRQYLNYTHTTGVVVGEKVVRTDSRRSPSQSLSESDDVMIHALVRYQAAVGDTITFMERQGGQFDSGFEKGETIKVIYDPQKPYDRARAYSWMTFWEGGQVFGLFGLIFICIGLFFRVGRKKKATP
ncbi:MAG: DUF3592 domain-containing protein [Bacteroidota bacterium]